MSIHKEIHRTGEIRTQRVAASVARLAEQCSAINITLCVIHFLVSQWPQM